MLLSLVDILRCPEPHEESALVLSVESWQMQRVNRGTLGCPVCHRRYGIVDGIPHFGGDDVVRHDDREHSIDPIRIAAQLGLTEPGGAVLLTGRYASAHRGLIEVVDVACILVDAAPTAAALAVNFEGIRRLPIADQTLRGAAVDADRASPAFVADVARCLRPRGRLILPGIVPVPGDGRRVAMDCEEQVVEVIGTGATVALSRSRPR